MMIKLVNIKVKLTHSFTDTKLCVHTVRVVNGIVMLRIMESRSKR